MENLGKGDQDVFAYMAKLFADEIDSYHVKIENDAPRNKKDYSPDNMRFDYEREKHESDGKIEKNVYDKGYDYGRVDSDYGPGKMAFWDNFPRWDHKPDFNKPDFPKPPFDKPGWPPHDKPDHGHDDPYEALKNVEARTPDGTGNNEENPDWGTAHHHYVRVTPASYPGDGSGDQWGLPEQNTGLQGIPPNPPNQVGDLPQPREITDAIMAQGPDEDIPNAAGMNEFLQFFGQYLTHDVAEASLLASGDPPLFLDGLPFPFGRSPYEKIDGVRQQENEETSFLDLSTVYGKSEDMLDLLRAKTPDGGELSAKLLTGSQDNLLPTFQEVAVHHGLVDADGNFDAQLAMDVIDPNPVAPILPESFAAGDNRVNQQSPLITHHTIWLRNHNWHVEELEKKFPDWSQEELFEAARAMNEAEWQHVVYNEYVVKMLGEDALSKYSGYQADIDPSVINEWTTVAFRFGHDQSSNDLRGLEENGAEAFVTTLAQAFADANAAQAVRDADSLQDWVRGQLSRYTQEIDGKVVDGNRNALFGIPATDENGNPIFDENGDIVFATVDLEVLDIQRGRDHGVGNYNELREGLGLSTYDSFEKFAYVNGIDSDTLEALKDVYDNDISKLDSIVGGLLEAKDGDSQLGETFTILNVIQFENLRDGDRYFYLERFKDNPELIEQIESASLSDIIARNTDIEYVYHDAFAAHERIGGTAGNDEKDGTPGADLVMGYDGHDILKGHEGDDDIHGGYGNDVMYGGHGSDLFVFKKDSGHDKVMDFDRHDKIDLSDYGFSSMHEVKAASSYKRGTLTIELSEDDKVELVGMKLRWLNEDHFILDHDSDSDGLYA